MKKILLSGFVLCASVIAIAQPKTPVKTPVTKPVTKPAVILKTSQDSLNYVLGEIAAYNVSNFLTQAGIENFKINTAIFNKAVTDILNKQPTLIDDVTANAMLNNYVSKRQAMKSKTTIEEGEKFLAENKKKKGVITTASGLQYEVITEGTSIQPTLVDTFVAHYRGTLLNGTQFDASYDRGQPLEYPVSSMIKGWIEALQLMKVGSKWKLYVPYELGYGLAEQGQIPAGSLLIFEMELLDVKKKQ